MWSEQLHFFKHNIFMKLYTDLDPLGQISGHIYWMES